MGTDEVGRGDQGESGEDGEGGRGESETLSLYGVKHRTIIFIALFFYQNDRLGTWVLTIEISVIGEGERHYDL